MDVMSIAPGPVALDWFASRLDARGGRARRWEDRDVERAGRPVHVVLTVFWHGRSARRLAGRSSREICAHENREELARALAAHSPPSAR